MNGVSDAVDQFTREVGRNCGGNIDIIGNGADGRTSLLQRVFRPTFQLRQHFSRDRAGVCRFLFDSRIALPRIVVHLAAGDTLQQALKMFQHVAIVPADRGFKGNRGHHRIFFVDKFQEAQTLLEYIPGGDNHARNLPPVIFRAF